MERDNKTYKAGKSIKRFLLSALLLLALPAFAGRPDVPALSVDDAASVAAGDIVLIEDPNDDEAMYAYMDIAADRDTIWKALNDADLIESSSSAVTQCNAYSDLTHAGVRTIKLHYVLNIAWSEVTYYIRRQHHTNEHYLEWTLDPEKDSEILLTNGYYVLEDQGASKTRLIYWAKTQSGRRVPGWIKDLLTNHGLKGWLDTVKTTSEAS